MATEAPWRRRVAGLLLSIAVVVALLPLVAAWEPRFYRERSIVGMDPAAAEQAARRLVSDVSALRAAAERPGSWEAMLDEAGINAWFALDQPRNHPTLLPGGASGVRVRLAAGRVEAGVRLGFGPVSTIAWVAVEVRLRDVNQLGILVEDAGFGRLPLPRGLILGELARRFRRLGFVAAVRPLDGRSVLVVYIPSTHGAGGPSHWLESLAVGQGFLAVAGRTLPPDDRLDAPDAAAR
ncbi:MAG: hypothetical protein ACKOC8_02065 [Pirellulales bacterium]